MSLRTRIKNFCDPHYGKVQCDICGEWGVSNPNYEGCNGKAFVHVSPSGARFVHSQHIIRSYFAKQKKYEIVKTKTALSSSTIEIKEIPKLILGGERKFL